MTEQSLADTQTPRAGGKAAAAIDRLMLGIGRYWLEIITVLFGIWVITPWLAPVLMAAGMEQGARIIYAVYSFQCHQLPQRSYFLFGPRLMYSMREINEVWPYLAPFQLRQFIGTPEMGYKVAWSDRMVSFYTPLFIGAVVMLLARRRVRRKTGQPTAASGWSPMPLRWFLLALLPLAVDGTTHLINDIIGFGTGFRDTNAWLAVLTGNIFPPTFYAGDAIGSFNWWMRLLTGLLAGFAVVWLFFPHLEQGFIDMHQSLERKLKGTARRTAASAGSPLPENRPR